MVSSISGSSAWAGVSQAYAQRPDPKERFKQMDADGSGGLSLDEFKAGSPQGDTNRAEALFSKIDSDGDGTVTQDESDTFAKQMEAQLLQAAQQFRSGQAGGGSLAELLGKLDEDDDGALSLDEFKVGAPKGADEAKSAEMFQRIDSNGDGSLSADELTQADQARPQGGMPPPPPQQGASTEDDEDSTQSLIQNLIAQLASSYANGSNEDDTYATLLAGVTA
ncbi:hypothetical protein GCM10007860_33770 [Chitiniphilus shinanonensis]|uniref:EF-hand domain-containing protein n=1 Tax=Chitiniphilus shinanonensis TaxID=553088 RepID=A0ABQ6BXR8_9NEIS|nr:EF-hand domain-containing protein [Chitiniphilus shinanonensis]GLS06207.1 hypothetical protein GCM10007860_33770 [Chitiniphilus shinanonensis]